MIPQPPDSYMLRNIHEVQVPEAVSWFPQTIGWKIVFAAIAVWICYQIYRRVKHWWVNRYRNEAAEALMQLKANEPDWPFQMVRVIKIVMIYLDSKNASLHGSPLLTKMDRYSDQSMLLAENSDVKQWLACAENSKLTPPDFESVRSKLLLWIKTHQVNEEGEL